MSAIKITIIEDEEDIQHLLTYNLEVANVSHELKTPVTTIKGFAETLIDGAKDDPDDLDRFLGIISRQTVHILAHSDH